MATLGYVRSSNGPDLAQVGVNEQLVSHTFPNTTAETLRITHVSAWVGNWGGTATMRFGIWAASSSSAAPGALLARTGEFSPSVNYMDGAGGQLRTVALETPYDLAPGQVICLGVASRNNQAGIAMYQASAISQPNESFYRKSITGTTLQSASGSSASNEGHLAIYVTGTTNVAPDAPTLLGPSGTVTGNLTPTISIQHNDPNGDKANAYRIQVEAMPGETLLETRQWSTNTADGGTINHTYSGPALSYHSEYRYRAQTRDEHGEWGPYSGWVSFTTRHTNHAPGRPGALTGLGNRTGTRNVTTGADFTDIDYPYLPNGQAWERFEQVQWRLRRDSDNVLVLNPGARNTTSTEKSNARSDISFTMPAWNVQYTYEERHRDRSGAWSLWREVPVKAISGGAMDKPTSPTAGRKTNLANPGALTSVYRNTAPINATRIQFRLAKVVQGSETGVTVAVANFSSITVARDTTFSRTWAQGFGSLELEPGVEYQIAARAWNSTDAWTQYSPRVIFTANARPNTPTLYGPRDGQVRSTIPTVSVRATDADQPSSALDVTIRAYDGNDALLGTYSAAHNPLPGDDRVHTLYPPPFVTGHGTYKWQAQSDDGFLNSAWSPLWTFTYAAVPAVSITSPAAGVITTSHPLIEWTSTDQTHWRVRGYDGGNLVYDTGQIAGGEQQHTITDTANWIGGERWNNHESFDWQVSVRDSSTLWGDSDPVTLTLEYIPPTPLTIESVEAMAFPGAEGTHYAVISTSQPEANEGDFIRTIGDRVEIDGPAGNEIEGTLIPGHFDSGSSADTSFADFDMTSNQWYRWSFRYEVQAGVDVIESDPVYAEMMVSWHGTLLHMPFDPLGTFVWLPYGTEQYHPEWEIVQGGVMVEGRRTAPLRFRDPTDYARYMLEATFVPREGATSQQQFDDFVRLVQYQSPSKSPTRRPETVCLREGRGGRFLHRLYGEISSANPRYTYTRISGVNFEFTELGEHPSSFQAMSTSIPSDPAFPGVIDGGGPYTSFEGAIDGGMAGGGDQ